MSASKSGKRNYRLSEKEHAERQLERDKAQARREIALLSDSEKLRIMSEGWWKWAGIEEVNKRISTAELLRREARE